MLDSTNIEEVLTAIVLKEYGVDTLDEVKEMFEAGLIPLDDLFNLVTKAQSEIKMAQVKATKLTKGVDNNDK